MIEPTGYTDELTQSLTLEKAEELEDEEVIEGFIRYLDRSGYNMHILKAIRSLLGVGK